MRFETQSRSLNQLQLVMIKGKLVYFLYILVIIFSNEFYSITNVFMNLQENGNSKHCCRNSLAPQNPLPSPT